MKRPSVSTPALLLIVLYGLFLAGPLIAPYGPDQQLRGSARRGPTPITFRNADGDWTLWPHVLTSVASERPRSQPLRFFVPSESYEWMGLTLRTRLYGLDESQAPLAVLGTDHLGRDVLTRTLHGGATSLAIGLSGVLLAALLGTTSGIVSGYWSRPFDPIIMRLVDVVLALPVLFLVMGLRTLYPEQISSSRSFSMVILAFGLAGWAIFARVIRGQVLSLKQKDFVLWARVAGASHWRILTRHILPATRNTMAVQSLVLLPLFILGEVTLSFLGVGVQPPTPSWGNLLAEAGTIPVMTSQPWRLAPAVLILITVLGFNLLADRLKDVDRRRALW